MNAPLPANESRLHEIMMLQRAILDNAGYAIIASTPDCVIHTFNPAAERMLGYSAAEMIGATPAIFHDLAEVEARTKQFSAELGVAIAPGCETFVARARRNLPNEYEWTYIRKDGTRFPVLLTVTALRGEAGEITGFLGLAVDITERKKTLRALEQFKYALDHTVDCVFICRADDFRFVYVNEGAKRQVGYSEAELLGMTVLDIKPEFTLERYRQTVQPLLDGTQPSLNFEALHRHKDGHYILVEVTLNAVRQAPYEPRLVAIVRDITQRRQDEARLRQLSRAVEQSPASVVIANLAGDIEYVNPRFTEVTGYTLAEVLGKNPRMWKSGDKSPDEYRELWQTLTAGKVWRGEFHNRKKNGESFWESASISPILDAAGSVTHYVAVKEDITERKRADELLRAKNEELKGFAYTVSHDLKAPLRGISGYAQELERRHKEGLTDRAQFCITQIITASKNLDALIEDLLKYSRLDTDIPTLTEVNLPELIQRILRDRTHMLTEMKAEMIANVPAITLRTWERGLNQVLANIIDNAIKYSRNSQPPRLTINAEAASGACCITVTDNGIGFDMKYHDRIFGLFNRLVRADEFEGTGAGLAIVKKLMEKLGGSVRAESAPGQGAAFIVELPVSSAAEKAP